MLQRYDNRNPPNEYDGNIKRLYYNVSIPHDDRISVAGSPTPASFSEVRSSPLFNGCPKDWFMSVVRFTIPTAYIPIQYFPVEVDPTNPNNVNRSIYTITLSYLGVDYQVNLQWVTQDQGAPPPRPPTASTISQFSNDPQYLFYYSLFSYTHFATIINNALDDAFTTNIVPLLPAPPMGKVYKSPFFTYDSSTGLYTLHTSKLFLDTETNPIHIYMNTFLNANFDTSFDQVYYSYTASDGKNVRYVILNRGNNETVDNVDPSGFSYTQEQEWDTTGQMTSFTSIVIRSNSLPASKEDITVQPKIDQSGRAGISGNSEAIISDFEVDLSSGKNIRGFIHYVPSAEYRKITLHGNEPISRIDIDILWKDNYDNLYPVLIPAHDIATIKLLFQQNKKCVC